MADLNQIYQAIGSLQTSITQMENELKRDRREAGISRDRMMAQQDKHSSELVYLRRKQDELENKMNRVEPFVNEAERWRQRGIGFGGSILFLGMVAGVIGAKYIVPALESIARFFR